MSNIVVLAGSVRKGGNTDRLVEAFVEGAKINNSVEVLSVADYKVNPCVGCNTCFIRENGSCFQKDDMTNVYEKVSKADIVIIASPVYFYGLSAQLKAVIDRFHTPMRNKFKLKKLGLLLVATSPEQSVFDAIKVQYCMILDYFKLDNCGMVLANGVKDKGDIEGNKALGEAYNMGKVIN